MKNYTCTCGEGSEATYHAPHCNKERETPSLLKRFEEKFCCKEQNCCDGKNMADHFTIAEMQDFFRAALLKIKGEMGAGKENTFHEVDAYFEGKNKGIDDCLAILTRALEE